MKYKFGSIITDGSGKLGGQVFSKNHYGPFLKNKVSPVQPNTSYQIDLRSKMASVTSAWNSLTDSQRSEWMKFSENYPQKDKFGHTFYLSGFNFFRKINMVRLNQSMSLLSTPLTPLPSPIWELIDIQAFSLNPSIFVFINPSPPAGYVYQIFSTPILSPGVNYCKGKFVLIGNIVEGADFPQDIYDLWYAKFSGTLEQGYALFFKIALIDVTSGFVSSYVIKKVLIQSGRSAYIASNWDIIRQFSTTKNIRSISPLNANNLILGSGTDASLYSTPLDLSSFPFLSSLPSQSTVNFIASGNNGRLFFGSSLGGNLYYSDDSGATLHLIGNLGSETIAYRGLFIEPNILFVGTGLHGKLFRINTINLSISEVFLPISCNYISAICSISENVLLIGTIAPACILKSIDGGYSFSLTSLSTSETQIRSVVSLENGICLASCGNNDLFLRSIDSGDSWYTSGPILSFTTIHSIVNLNYGVLLGLSYSPKGIIISYNYGISWHLVSNPLPAVGYSGGILFNDSFIYIISQTLGYILRSTI